MSIIKKFLAVLFCVSFAHSSQAAITIGSLTYDSDINAEVISDSLNNLEWLRGNILADLTYEQTLAAISTGGVYEGWSIAHNDEAQLFTDALLGSNACNIANTAYCFIGSDVGTTEYYGYAALLGDSYFPDTSTATFREINYGMFLSDNGFDKEVGLIHYQEEYSIASNVLKKNEWRSIAASDAYSASGSQYWRPISWMLYRDAPVINVPESTSLFFICFGMLSILIPNLLRRNS